MKRGAQIFCAHTKPWQPFCFHARAFNYETRPAVSCKHLPWVGDRRNAEVKRNVNCDLYEKKGKSGVILQRSWKAAGQELTWAVFHVQSMSGSALWGKGKTTGERFPPPGAG